MAQEKISGIHTAISKMEGVTYYTRSQVADKLGVSYDTVRRWQTQADKNGAPVPTKIIKMGKQKVWVWTDEDLSKLKDWQKEIKLGRPRKIA